MKPSKAAAIKISKQQRETLRGMFEGLCVYCGTPLDDRWHADHVEHVERKMAWVEGWFVCTKSRMAIEVVNTSAVVNVNQQGGQR